MDRLGAGGQPLERLADDADQLKAEERLHTRRTTRASVSICEMR
jgi:hypothetical protein